MPICQINPWIYWGCAGSKHIHIPRYIENKPLIPDHPVAVGSSRDVAITCHWFLFLVGWTLGLATAGLTLVVWDYESVLLDPEIAFMAETMATSFMCLLCRLYTELFSPSIWQYFILPGFWTASQSFTTACESIFILSRATTLSMQSESQCSQS